MYEDITPTLYILDLFDKLVTDTV